MFWIYPHKFLMNTHLEWQIHSTHDSRCVLTHMLFRALMCLPKHILMTTIYSIHAPKPQIYQEEALNKNILNRNEIQVKQRTKRTKNSLTWIKFADEMDKQIETNQTCTSEVTTIVQTKPISWTNHKQSICQKSNNPFDLKNGI